MFVNYSTLLARFVSMLMSWMQAGDLRNKLYVEMERNELMRTALEDIVRMDPEGRLGWLAKETLDRVDH